MINKDDLSNIICTCLACKDCDTSSIDDFIELIADNGPEFVQQQRDEMIAGSRLLNRNLYKFSAEEIVDSGGFDDRAYLMARNFIDFGCAKVCAVIDDIPEDTAYIGFVLFRRRDLEMPREEQPFKPRRRSKPARLTSTYGNLFEDFGIYVPNWVPKDAPESAKQRERERKETARRNHEALFPSEKGE